MIFLLLSLIVIFLLVLIYFYQKQTSNKKLKVAFIYSSVRGFLQVHIPSKKMIDTEILPDNLDVISVDVGDWSRILEILQEQYDNGVRNFVGMAGSGLVIAMQDFILLHPDANFICSGSTVTTLPFDSPNFYRTVEVDRKSLLATKKSYQIENPQILSETGTQWAQSITKDTMDIWNTDEVLWYDPNNLDWLSLDNFVEKGRDLWIFSTLNPQVLIKIIERYPDHRIFLGDGIYPYQLGIENREILLPLYYGYSSYLLTTYGHPFVVCLYDALIVLNNSYLDGTSIIEFKGVGYNGQIQFDESRNRKYGRTTVMKYINGGWKYDSIYGKDKLGEYMSSLSHYEEIKLPDQKLYPLSSNNKVAVMISTEINDNIKNDILNMLKDEKLPSTLDIQIFQVAQDSLYNTLDSLYKNGYRIFTGFIIYALDNDSLRFFQEHPDVLNINCGSTISNNSDRPGNIYRYIMEDNYVLDSFRQEHGDKDLVVLYEKTSAWAISLATELGGNIHAVDFYQPDLALFDELIGNNKYVFLMTPINENLREIINRYPDIVFYLGKFNNDYELGISGREIYCYISMGFSSDLLEKYDYIAVNCYDSLYAIETSIRYKESLGKLHLVGYSGDLSLDYKGDRKYGRVVIKSYDGEWRYYKVYGYENIGKYSSLIV